MGVGGRPPSQKRRRSLAAPTGADWRGLPSLGDSTSWQDKLASDCRIFLWGVEAAERSIRMAMDLAEESKCADGRDEFSQLFESLSDAPAGSTSSPSPSLLLATEKLSKALVQSFNADLTRRWQLRCRARREAGLPRPTGRQTLFWLLHSYRQFGDSDQMLCCEF